MKTPDMYRSGIKRTGLFFSLIVFLILTSVSGKSEMVRISGRYWHIFNNGGPSKTNAYNFVAIIGPSEWKIAATNTNDPKECGIIQYDGASIYVVNRYSLNAYKFWGYVYPGQFYIPEGADDPPVLFFPWMVFCLKPDMLEKFEHNGCLDPPAPWGKRYSLLDFGFKWVVTDFDSNNLIKRIDAVRDSTLDLNSRESEMRRASLNYPFEYSARDHRLETLRARQSTPDGFVRATYRCEDLYRTNNLAIPSVATFSEYMRDFKHKKGRLVFHMILQADEIELLNETSIPEITAPSQMNVHDYRYRRVSSRTKFNFARYELSAGDSFPGGNDPRLLAQAADWMRHGPSFDTVRKRQETILAGMLGITLVVCACLVFGLKKTRNK